MAEEISYYAIVNDFSSHRAPCRRPPSDQERRRGTRRDLRRRPEWGRSALLNAYERGDLTNDMIPISEEEADRIVTRIQGMTGAAE